MFDNYYVYGPYDNNHRLRYGKLIQLGEINPIKVKKVIPVRYKIKNLSAFKET